MQRNLILNADPTQNLQAATKRYVEKVFKKFFDGNIASGNIVRVLTDEELENHSLFFGIFHCTGLTNIGSNGFLYSVTSNGNNGLILSSLESNNDYTASFIIFQPKDLNYSTSLYVRTMNVYQSGSNLRKFYGYVKADYVYNPYVTILGI